MKVLIATDGTKYAEAAVEMLGKFDLGANDSIKVISVVDLAMPLAVDVYGGYLPDTTQLEKAARENAEKAVAVTVNRLAELFGDELSVSSDILFGSPDSRIVETAESMSAELIVIGSHGYNRWERLLLGSVSHSVVHHAPCSVMVVRIPESETADR
jgi:nucleotide-binding universal stress UspA family protein